MNLSPIKRTTMDKMESRLMAKEFKSEKKGYMMTIISVLSIISICVVAMILV